MSYKVLDSSNQMVDERIRRLGLILDAFSAEGISVHEKLHELWRYELATYS